MNPSRIGRSCLLLAVAVFVGTAAGQQVPEDFARVTCGSMIKLVHHSTGYRLHSHEIQWGSGSHQQSVTATESDNDMNSNWIVKEAHGKKWCSVGKPIKCGSTIRLEHVLTRRNLHTHDYLSPLSHQQEVSAFGEEGEGDQLDEWEVVCLEKTPKKAWMRASKIMLKNPETGAYLHSHASHRFDRRNCGMSCPIMGQQEVTAFKQSSADNHWYADDGMYFTVD